ncbi:MAG: FdhF/YdeP family oxidoreductase [Candidatus Marinimicrobia bacterium]|jgi:molybdopterin-dependent oxidoreductase alpha subunit|nr:FdhF/YdeP family oxidoreductase [Candidatus Neomarinimicrobiota bacterium]MBT3937318.1 FdhF/YdeP family oxidoreductase [Candidatus Neomarinimicrobiota bacterium]MBT4635512.1 FdhF/YdeP family oxidoreductase [Candidatus Neomarinimicrobiota bacterium]MBT5362631.1 FdhF/YdeP family oxidoreductase [Candidatus Neomarinimicrobiota bacterium]MBT5461587.1 FdhF/YdeP family oxidoreductase [Candidatus Neomarinimicrobiota bacterium]
MGRKVGFRNMWKALSSKNTCKTCALGMGGQIGGMRNEQNHWPEVCKKSIQAMAADMQGAIQSEFFKRFSVNQLRQFSPRELEHAGRITTPLLLKSGATHYAPISWDDAFNRIGIKLKTTNPDRSFFYFSGRSSNEAGFLLQLFARVFGTNHINNCSYYCHQASGVGLTGSLGSGTATIELEDLDHCDLFFLIGANPSSNHPRLLTKLKNIRKRGGKVIVINPVVEKGLVEFRVPSDPLSLLFGSKISSDYVQVRPGGDLALFSGLAKIVLEEDADNQLFIAAATEGYDDFKANLESIEWKDIEAGSGITKNEIESIGRQYIQAKNVVFSWCMGVTHHAHGTANVQSIVNLALLRGMVGKKHAGLLPIRGHSNVQGMGSMAVTPTLKKVVFDRLTAEGISVSTMSGYDTMACIQAAKNNEMDFAFCLGGNLYGSNPDSAETTASLSKIETIVYASTTLNTGHAWGTGVETIILPVLARDEEKQSTTQESMFSFVRLSDGGIIRHKSLQSEVEVISEIASRVLGNNGIFNWEEFKNHNSVRKTISKIIPGFENMEKIGTSKKEFHIPGRILHKPIFPTSSGKAKFIYHAIPNLDSLKGDEFQLLSVRSEGQFNTVVYEEKDLYRNQERRNVVLMNKNDMSKMGFSEDDSVSVKSKTGVMNSILVRPFDIKKGAVLMYYPEVNSLISQSVDPLSRTPGFKSTLVTIKRT